MDEIRNDSPLVDDKIVKKDEEDEKSSFKTSSPVLNNHTSNRCKRYDSASDDDFFGSQINHSARHSGRRSSLEKKKDDYDFVVPDPISSPFYVSSRFSSEHKAPEIHTIGSLLKNDGFAKVKYQEPKNVYESLGMDKDVSWDSTMASPAPKMPKEELNTIERQTLLPEDGFRNIQPRALFSPSHADDEGGFKPIRHSSDSELSHDGSYETGVRLSDVCETLKDLNVKSLENKNDLTVTRSESPVLRVRKKPNMKKRGLLVSSPISLKIPEKEQSSWLPDDSFQNMSFSVIDEISKTETDDDKTLNVTKIYYESKFDNEEREGPVQSLDEILKPVMLLEQADVGSSSKTLKDVNFKKGLISFSNMINDECKKRGRENAEESCEKKKLKSDPDWDADLLNDVSSSQLLKTLDDLESKNANEEGIEDNLEKSEKFENFKGFLTASGKNLLNSTESLRKAQKLFEEEMEVEKFEKSENVQLKGFSTASGKCLSNSAESLKKAEKFFEEEMSPEKKFKGFSTASGKNLKMSEESLKKAQKIFEETDENIELKGFSTASGKNLAKSVEALKKAQNFFAEEVEDANFKSKNSQFKGFSTASGKEVSKSVEALKKAQNFFAEEFQPDSVENKSLNQENSQFKGFLTASGKNLSKSVDSLKKAEKFFEEDFKSGGFSTASGKNLANKPEALNKAKKFFEEELILPKEESSVFKGFSTASGKNVAKSAEALKKARTFFEEEIKSEILTEGKMDGLLSKDLEISESKGAEKSFKQIGFLSASGSTIQISQNALKTGQNFFKEELNIKNEVSSQTSQENASKATAFGKNEDEIPPSEPDTIIPPWLHVYNTSPSILTGKSADETEIKSAEPYLVKSPVLGSRDRFLRKIKKPSGKKLDFEEGKNLIKPTDIIRCRKRNSADFSFDFSVNLKKQKLEEEGGKEILERRRLARLEQKKSADKGKVKPKVGSFLGKKLQESQTPFSKFVNALPETYTREELLDYDIKTDVIDVNVENSGGFKFKGTDFFGSDCIRNTDGIPIGDGSRLILNDENEAGVEEFTDAFYASPGVEPSLISKDWVSNHYKWIVWKLAHYETSFPWECGGKCLTPENVILQLKYRYDREVDRSERSALKKILEGDDTSVKRLVLCVFSIKKVKSSTNPEEFTNFKCYELGLTDGWYSCNARTDPALIRYIENGKITIGTKIVTSGAELINKGQGISPLEVTDDVYLKIWTNSTRRIRWDAKLGFQKNSGPIPITLFSILPQGGIISRVDVIVVRVYPIVYVEKKADGSRVTRNRRAEDRALSAFQQEQEARIEKIYADIQSEYQSKNSKNLGEDDLDYLETGSELSSQQRNSLANNRNEEISEILREKLKAEKIHKRDVSELLKAKIIDLRKPDYDQCGLLSLWNPSDDILDLFQEGKALSITNLSAGNYNKSFRNVRLNTTRSTQYLEIHRKVDYPARSISRLCDITPKFEPDFDEIDVVGIVVYIHETTYGSMLSQTVFVTDSGEDFVGINFRGSCKDFGWENVLKLRSVVAASNLQWVKHSHPKKIPSVYVNENTAFSENPKQRYLQDGIDNVKKILKEDMNEFITKCQEEITSKLDETMRDSSICSNSSMNDKSFTKHGQGFLSKPNASSTPLKSRLTDVNEQESSPIAKKLEKLKCYGEPPPISPLIPRSHNVKFRSKFKVPFKQNNTTPGES